MKYSNSTGRFAALGDFSPEGYGRIVLWPTVGTCASIAVSLGYVALFQAGASEGVRWTMVVAAVVMPVILAPPLLIYLSMQNRRLALAERRMRALANTDALTGLLNRGAFSRVLDNALAAGQSGALLFLDVDRFKTVNDRFGHAHGDDALRIIANALRLGVRQHDVIGRLGGEEFGIFLPSASCDQAQLIAERIRSTVAQAPFLPFGKRHPLSVSLGGAVFRHGAEAADLFRIADKRLYEAKAAGRDRAIVGGLADTASDLAVMVP